MSILAENHESSLDGGNHLYPLVMRLSLDLAIRKAYQNDLIEPSYRLRIRPLTRRGKYLLLMAWSADDWFSIVQIFSIRRSPMYPRIFPQVVGDGPGGLWTPDLAKDMVRGESESEPTRRAPGSSLL
ncbi:unnamed protein product [Rhizoctonia solani]|uniref:Uncharacterized protein n=1 Tax=Rhizoctonia solani TaxID=456999 RepID=A0A8H2WLA9_9AGAM|nr:unnamed protein product [Rhizoctonia solani]